MLHIHLVIRKTSLPTVRQEGYWTEQSHCCLVLKDYVPWRYYPNLVHRCTVQPTSRKETTDPHFLHFAHFKFE